MELITTAFRRMLAKKDSVFQENFRRTQMYNFYGDVILKGIQCFNDEHGFVPWQHGQNILKELKSVNMICYNINRLDSFILKALHKPVIG